MVGVSSEVVKLIYHLLPGFLAAWIFYGLTAHPKRSPFERVVQALIFTALVRVFLIPIKIIALKAGTITHLNFGEWNEGTAYVWSITLAILLGHGIAYFANGNIYHTFLYKYGVTSRTSFPSEWYSAFARWKLDVILHLEGERRIRGWPNEWPDQPDSGHFVLQDPQWILDDNTEVPILVDEFILIPAINVHMVEFLKNPGDIDISGKSKEIEEITKLMIDLRKKKNQDKKNN